MENLKVLDEKGNTVILRPIKLIGRNELNNIELNSESIDFKEVAKEMIVRKMAEEMYKSLFFTEMESPNGGLIIEARTYFYGL